ncbi:MULTISPECIES: LysE family translocator [Micromonospora]|uniref:LysE family translocator n=2 Tax=Micromonospora chalcea TaxID=1874 RepID=A0ABX9YD77_MICCH|nr:MULTISPECIES: LysE family translocator [Micromonospora]MBP1784097.1 threonine/homoserine/homoserine lactone efflux protein [Micromonospora sp. HB375]MCK1804496.1 LysE family translocator [Micromonospora sp. R42106]MCK1829865.1 LysE family translocator [Micromonospora sp. R42003]MCK1841768.1 LysE family translocator [Micromonospora sp. R42004]MCM1020427.1 LysE family translocator [Micromonospora sp. XM-20-01]
MSDIQIISFVAASLLIIIVPGVDFALVTRQTVRYGRRAGFVVLAGLFVAALVHASFATAGLSALLVSSPTLYTVLRVAGALYLLYLGGTILWATRPRRTAPAAQPVPVGAGGAGPDPETGPAPVPEAPAADEPHVARRSFVMGVTSQLLNVKVVVFYVSFVPQFVRPGDGAAARTAVLAATFIGLAVLWWACYIMLIDRLQPWLTRPSVLLVIERLTGLILIVLAIRIALSR